MSKATCQHGYSDSLELPKHHLDASLDNRTNLTLTNRHPHLESSITQLYFHDA